MNKEKEKYGKAENLSEQTSKGTKELLRDKQDQDDPKNIKQNPDNISNPGISEGTC